MSQIIEMQQQELKNIPGVEYTETWAPVHHTEVVSSMDTVLAGLGVEPSNKRFEVSKNGKDLFSTWLLPARKDDKDQLSIGFRNSMQKRFSLGVVAGHNVMVCSNMCFWGDFLECRKHTSGLTLEALYIFLEQAIKTALHSAFDMQNWFKGLHELPLFEDDRKILTFDAMERGVLPPSKFNALQIAYKEELQDNRDPDFESLAHFHGSFTRVLRGSSIDIQQGNTRKLNTLLTDYIEEEL